MPFLQFVIAVFGAAAIRRVAFLLLPIDPVGGQVHSILFSSFNP